MASPASPTPNDGFASEEEFEAWLRAHPENMEYFLEIMARAEKGDFGEIPSEMRELTQMVISKHRDAGRVRAVQRLLVEFFEELRRVHEGDPTAEALRELHERCGGIIDAALDLPEPHRGELLRELVPIRDSLRNIANDAS